MFDTSTLLLRLADFHWGATLLLIATLVAGYFLGQPARRLTLAWSAATAIVVLGILCSVPGWSMLHLFHAEPLPTMAALPAPPAASPPLVAPSIPRFQESIAIPPAPMAALPKEAAVEIPVKTSFTFDPAWTAFLAGTLGALLSLAWLLAGAFSARKIVDAATPANERLQNLLQQVGGEGALPRLLVSDRLSVAAAIGLRRPAILLPASLDATATDEDLRGLLAHELAHVRNGDLRLLALWRVLLVALWVNPLYWLLRRRMRLDQETLADAVAADQTNRQAYAERLVGWAREMSSGPSHPRLAGAAGLWESPSQLRRRITVLLDERFTLLRHCSRRWRAACLLAAGSLAVAASLVTLSPAEPTEAATEESKADFLPDAKIIAGLIEQPEILTLLVRVVDTKGEPIANAKVTPWALRSSQGHRGWLKKKNNKDSIEKMYPVTASTNPKGFAEVLYPRYSRFAEQVKTTGVSIRIDHPEYGYISEHIDSSLEDGPHTIELIQGMSLEIKPTIDGQPTDLDNIFVTTSDDRPRVVPEKTASGTLRIPSMKPGPVTVRLIRLDGENVTHFSPILRTDLKLGEPASMDVSLHPAQTVHGKVSDNVPRPVKQGRIKVETLPQTNDYSFDGTEWSTWTPIQSDGTFTIESWPAGEAIQLIALSDGYIATSGSVPKIIENPRDADSYYRPHVFETTDNRPLEVPMTPLVKCIVHAVDTEGTPLPDIKVVSCPNVGWWNSGSQIYCSPLFRSELFLRVRDYNSVLENPFPYPFSETTDSEGYTTLHLPAGRRGLTAGGKGYHLPIILGNRRHGIQLTVGETTNVKLTLQPAGTDLLGDWDKLAGIVFGCTTREGRRICALPGVQKKMEALRKRMREADTPRNPALLAEAYTAIAEALDGAGDAEEADKWRVKAAEQAGKIEANETTSDSPTEETKATTENPEANTSDPMSSWHEHNQAILTSEKLRREGKIDEAVEVLSNAFDKSPGHANLLIARAGLFFGAERYAEAIADYEEIRRQGNWFGAQSGLAHLLMNAKDESVLDPARAAQLLEEMVLKSPNRASSFTLSKLAKAYLLADNLEAAIDAQRRAVETSTEGTYESALEALHELQQRKNPALDANQHSIRVRIVDESGEPIEKAWVGLKLGSTEYSDERVPFNDVYPTEKDGWCVLPIGEERWGSVWVRAKGFALLPPLDLLNDENIRKLDGKSLTLIKTEGLELDIYNSDSGQVHVEIITPSADLTQLWIPSDWSGVFTRRIEGYAATPSNAIRLLTKEEKRQVLIPGIAPEDIVQILVASNKSGNLQFNHNFFWYFNGRFGDRNDHVIKELEELGHKQLSKSKYRITLPDAGKVRGRVVASEDGAPLSRPFQIESHPTGAIGYYGVATVTPDAEGRFEIERLADGHLKAVFDHVADDPWRWSISPDLGVRADTTTELLVTLERGVRVRGKIPLSPLFTGYEHNQSANVVLTWGNSSRSRYEGVITHTDNEGYYSAYVPAGKVKIKSFIGPFNDDGQPRYTIQSTITIPEGSEEQTIPTPDENEISEDQPSNGWDVG